MAFFDAYIAFGGNIGEAKPRILAAWELLGDAPTITVAARSQLYRTAPVGGPAGQNDYVNAVCRVETVLSARELLTVCLDIERRFGRERKERWPPRTLDIDLLLYGDEEIDEPGLRVPHPRLRERLFVIVPLADIASSEMKLPPDGKHLRTVLREALELANDSIEDWRSRVIG